MSYNNYEMVLSQVLPTMRIAEALAVDLSIVVEDTSDEVKRQVAKIEAAIKNGDALHRHGKYDGALKAFKEARALIYKILYPTFDVPSYVALLEDVMLPVSSALEDNLVDASLQVLDMLRPNAVKAYPEYGIKVDPPVNSDLKSLFETGYREAVVADESIQLAADQGVTLIVDNKPEAAIQVMKRALEQVSAGEVDSHLRAALELNLGAANVQLGDYKKGHGFGEKARKDFWTNDDMIGGAQALHLMAVSLHRSGDIEGAKELFENAAATLAKASEKSGGAIKRTQTRAGASDRVDPAFGFLRGEGAAIEARAERVGGRVSRELSELKGIADKDPGVLTYRVPGRLDGWGGMRMLAPTQKRQVDKAWKVGVPKGGKLAFFEIGAGKRPSRAALVNEVYAHRVAATHLAELKWQIVDTSTTTSYLTHLYSYVLLVKIADAYHALGQYEQAENNYLATARYTYLNKQIEATLLWIRIARNCLEWGHVLYKAEDLEAAKVQYQKIIKQDATVPDSVLYNTASLSVPADEARNLIQNLLTRPLPAINWEIAIFILTAHQYLQQIADGLDFYGLTLSPIHTFEYLQGVARGFAQETIQAEREFVNFKSREEAEEATRRELETTQAMAQAEADARFQQYLAAQEDESAAKNAHDLAVLRRNNAIDQRNAYSAASWAQIWAQAAAAALSGGEDAYWSEISELADKLDRGETIRGPGPKLAAAQLLSAGRKTRNYELAKMQDNIDQLSQAINLAKDQWDAAKRRTAAAEIAWQAAVQRAEMASAALDAFDAEFFTPETWNKMADVMRDIARSYLFRAIRIAKLMERAYNFENDTELNIIKSEYGHGVANPGPGRDVRLLGGDSLLKDIDSFTYHAVTTKTRKNSRIKDVISVAANFPAHFEEFRQTGLLSLETDLYEFDRLHPGFYGQRLESIEVEVIGVLPEGGVNGTLILGGVTRYRKRDHSEAQRVHQVDTMALSDFVLRNDNFVYRSETGVRGLFQGFGIGTTWQIHLPKRSNNLDFRRIFDIHLVLYYTALFDPALRTEVLQAPPRPDELARLRNYGLRYDFPDAWYSFYQSASVHFVLDRFRLPMNQRNFVTNGIAFHVVTQDGISNQGIELRITGPDETSGTATTGADGSVSTDDPQLAPLIGSDPLGEWQIEVLSGESISEEGELQLQRIYNVQVGLEYTFEYVEEVL
jgi:hypothetical protein